MSLRPDTHYIIPSLGSVYAALSPYAETLMRIIAGLLLIVHGTPKIMNPFGATGMVESLGFYPGAFWSPLLSCTEFFGGILLTIGLLTRPAAFATMIVLLVTVYFHWIFRGEGLAGAEKSILWASILFYFVVHGGNRYSVDARLGKEF